VNRNTDKLWEVADQWTTKERKQTEQKDKEREELKHKDKKFESARMTQQKLFFLSWTSSFNSRVQIRVAKNYKITLNTFSLE